MISGKLSSLASSLVLRRIFWSDAADKVDHLPDLLFSQLVLVSLHVSRHSITDHDKDLAIRRSVVPLIVREIRRSAPPKRHSAIAFAGRAMTTSAGPTVNLPAF